MFCLDALVYMVFAGYAQELVNLSQSFANQDPLAVFVVVYLQSRMHYIFYIYDVFGSAKNVRLPIRAICETTASVCFAANFFRNSAFRYSVSENQNRSIQR